MKQPQDLCHAEYRVFRRQIQQIRALAEKSHQRPSAVLRVLLDQALANQASMSDRVPGEVIRHG